MAADPDLETKRGGATLDAIRIDPVHELTVPFVGAAASRSKERALGLIANAGGTEIFVQVGFELVVGGHSVALAAFFVEAHPPLYKSVSFSRSGFSRLGFHRCRRESRRPLIFRNDATVSAIRFRGCGPACRDRPWPCARARATACGRAR